MPDNLVLIRSLYDAFGRGDVETILESVDPDVEWISNGNAETIPWGGKRFGRAGVASFFEALGEHIDFEVFEPRQFIGGGEMVTVLGHGRARFKSGGNGIFDSEWAHIFAITDGKLSSFREFYDTAAIERARAA